MAARSLNQDFLLSKLDELPTLPAIVYELSNVINDPMSSIKDVEKIMANDQSLTTKVLKLVNSAYYAIPGGVTNLVRAISYIGFDTIHQLVLSASIIEALDTKSGGPSTFDMNEFWKHSLGVAIAGETIAKATGHPLPSDMFTCGLVHDMGKVALFTIDRAAVEEISITAINLDKTFLEAERHLAIPNHTEIGRMLAEKWALPAQIQAVVKFHHQKDHRLRNGLSPELNKAVDIIFLSNLLVHAMKFGNSGYTKISNAPKEVLEQLGINPTTGLRELLKEIKQNFDKSADFMRVLGG